MFVNVGGASPLLRFVAREPLDGTDHDRRGPGHEGPLRSPPRGQALKQGCRGLGRGGGRRCQAGHVEPPRGHQERPTPLMDAGHGGQDRDRPRNGHGGGRRRWLCGTAHLVGAPGSEAGGGGGGMARRSVRTR